MKVPVVMPQLGLTMTEGSVNTWLMKIGDTVHKGDMLFVVSTDKADMEIESLDEGRFVRNCGRTRQRRSRGYRDCLPYKAR